MTDENPVVPFPREINEKPQAADWLAKLDRGGLTASERAAFEAWLAEDPRNKIAIRKIASFWYGLDAPLSAQYVLKPRKTDRRGRLAGVLSVDYGRLFKLTRMPATRAAAVLLVVLAFVLVEPHEPADEAAYFSTDIGRSRQISLSDGSMIKLNTNSVLEQDYSSAQRTVRLVSGEAIFDVAHNPERPFVVYAADGVIRAVGTRFAIRVGADTVSVTVTEGRIALQQRLTVAEAPGATTSGADAGAVLPLADPIFVQQGEVGRIRRSEGATKRPISAREVNERLSWVDGELVFYDRELESVIEELSRYTPVVIQIEDDDLKARRITGIIQIGDMDMMLESIEQTLGVTVERVSPNLIRLRS